MLSAEVFLKREVCLTKELVVWKFPLKEREVVNISELVVCSPMQVFLVRGGKVERHYSRIVLWGLTSAMEPAILRNTELGESCITIDDGCESAFRI